MEKKLTEEQLQQVIAEVQELSEIRKAEISRQEVTAILQELNLPDDLLDEAIIQLQRRNILAVQQKRQKQIFILVATILAGTIGLGLFFQQKYQHSLSQVTAGENRITLATDDGKDITAVERQNLPKLYYRVTLQDAPINQKLTINCDWIDPNSNIVHENRYQTKNIDQQVWPTYCFYQLGSDATAGNWQVKMKLGERVLSTDNFVVN
jgi:hypothetical protein